NLVAWPGLHVVGGPEPLVLLGGRRVAVGLDVRRRVLAAGRQVQLPLRRAAGGLGHVRLVSAARRGEAEAEAIAADLDAGDGDFQLLAPEVPGQRADELGGLPPGIAGLGFGLEQERAGLRAALRLDVGG